MKTKRIIRKKPLLSHHREPTNLRSRFGKYPFIKYRQEIFRYFSGNISIIKPSFRLYWRFVTNISNNAKQYLINDPMNAILDFSTENIITNIGWLLGYQAFKKINKSN